MRPIEEIFAIAERGLGVLIDGYDDHLYMRIAIALQCGLASDVSKRLYPPRVLGVVVVPFHGLAGQSINLLSRHDWFGA